MDELGTLRARLLEQAYLFDRPDAYAAGVEDAFDAILEVLGESPRELVDIDLAGNRPRVMLSRV